MANNKVFCIGLNKTGTTSIHKALGILGYNSVHYLDSNGKSIKNTISRNYKNGEDILKGIKQYDAFSDWSHPSTNHLFVEFDKQYPNSKFILNTRDMEDWINSREKHLKRTPNLKKLQQANPNNKWLKMDKDIWRQEFIEHHENVQMHFSDRPNDLLIFDITKGDAWEELCPFLNKEIPNVEFPKSNRASDQSRKIKLINLCKRIVKKILNLFN